MDVSWQHPEASVENENSWLWSVLRTPTKGESRAQAGGVASVLTLPSQGPALHGPHGGQLGQSTDGIYKI